MISETILYNLIHTLKTYAIYGIEYQQFLMLFLNSRCGGYEIARNGSDHVLWMLEKDAVSQLKNHAKKRSVWKVTTRDAKARLWIGWFNMNLFHPKCNHDTVISELISRTKHTTHEILKP